MGSPYRACFKLALVPAMALLLAGCGYQLQTAHQARFTDPGIRISLEPFQNLSFDSDAGALMATRLREELRRNGFRGTFERAGADFLVEGKVRGVREDVVTHGAEGFSLEHALTLMVDIRVVEVSKARVLLKDESVSESATYFAGRDFQYTESNRRMALEDACRRLAGRLGKTLRMVL